MNADAFYRAVNHYGERVTIRRLTGTQRIAFGVECQASVRIGAAQVLVGGVFQMADEVRVGDREMRAAQWPQPPRHGDQVQLADGHYLTIHGECQVWGLDNGDKVYSIRCLGG